MTDTVRIALANVDAPATCEEAVTTAVAAIADAANAGAHVLCFPECFIPGYRWPDSRIPAPEAVFLDEALTKVRAATRDAGITVILGTERITPRGLQISACVINPDGSIAGWQDKGQLDPGEESQYPAYGEGRQVFTAGSLTFGIVICHEGWRYPETVRWAARRGAQVVFHPFAAIAEPGSYRPTTFGDPANTFHEHAMRCRAAENTIWFASVNAASEGSPMTSAIIRPDGTVHCWQPYGQAGLLVADIDLSLATGLLASRCRTSPL